MNRPEFDAIRDVPDKKIVGDIRFSRPGALAPAVAAQNIPIQNSQGIDLRLNITYNAEVGSKTFNVHVPGTGPICRLDVDGTNHGDAGRSHKHALKGERCPDRNLPDDVTGRPDLAGKGVREVFEEFCQMAQITHEGVFAAPDEGP
jgi:hypothetical protein